MTASKILTETALVSRAGTLRQQSRSVVFTNGCFDLLHRGHVTYVVRKLGAAVAAPAEILAVLASESL